MYCCDPAVGESVCVGEMAGMRAHNMTREQISSG